MEFYISASVLQKVVKQLGVVAKTNAKDFTGLISIEALEDNVIRFVANNTTNSLLVIVNEDVLVRTPGIFVVEFGKFKSFVLSFPAWSEGRGVKEFKIYVDNNKLFVSASNTTQNRKAAKAKLKLLGYDVYSVRQPMPFTGPMFSLNAALFQEATSKVLYAVDPADSRPFITGVYFAIEKERICFAGTNGRLISEYVFGTDQPNSTVGEFLLKYDFVVNLKRLVDNEDVIQFEFDEKSVKAKCNNRILYGRLLVGHQFPNYRAPLENFKHELVLDKDLFDVSPMVESLNADDNFRLTIELQDGNLLLYNELAKLKYENVVDFSEAFTADVNGLFLKATIDSIKDSQVVFRFTHSDTPLIFDSAAHKNQRSLIMPLRKR